MSAVVQFHQSSEIAGQSNLLAAVLQASPEALAVIQDGRVMYSNPAFSKLFALPYQDGVQGRLLTEIIPEMYFEGRKHPANTQRDITKKLSFTSVRRDKTEVSLTISPVPERNISVITARHTRSTLSDQKSVPGDSLGRAVSSIVHDFNNLITGVLLYSELLTSELPRSTREHAHVLQIRRAAENGARLTRQLLTIAKPETAEKDECCWNSVITEMQDLFARLTGAHIQLETKLADGLERVRLTSVQMQQILLNLVLNARDAMPDGGHLLLETSFCPASSKSSIVLAVSDTGMGMSGDAHNSLFEPFVTTKGEGKGSGLGLFSISNIVKQSGGCIQVESAMGCGARVVIRMPTISKTQVHKSSIHKCTKRGHAL